MMGPDIAIIPNFKGLESLRAGLRTIRACLDVGGSDPTLRKKRDPID